MGVTYTKGKWLVSIKDTENDKYLQLYYDDKDTAEEAYYDLAEYTESNRVWFQPYNLFADNTNLGIKHVYLSVMKNTPSSLSARAYIHVERFSNSRGKIKNDNVKFPIDSNGIKPSLIKAIKYSYEICEVNEPSLLERALEWLEDANVQDRLYELLVKESLEFKDVNFWDLEVVNTTDRTKPRFLSIVKVKAGNRLTLRIDGSEMPKPYKRMKGLKSYTEFFSASAEYVAHAICKSSIKNKKTVKYQYISHCYIWLQTVALKQLLQTMSIKELDGFYLYDESTMNLNLYYPKFERLVEHHINKLQ